VAPIKSANRRVCQLISDCQVPAWQPITDKTRQACAVSSRRSGALRSRQLVCTVNVIKPVASDPRI